MNWIGGARSRYQRKLPEGSSRFNGGNNNSQDNGEADLRSKGYALKSHKSDGIRKRTVALVEFVKEHFSNGDVLSLQLTYQMEIDIVRNNDTPRSFYFPRSQSTHVTSTSGMLTPPNVSRSESKASSQEAHSHSQSEDSDSDRSIAPESLGLRQRISSVSSTVSSKYPMMTQTRRDISSPASSIVSTAKTTSTNYSSSSSHVRKREAFTLFRCKSDSSTRSIIRRSRPMISQSDSNSNSTPTLGNRHLSQ